MILGSLDRQSCFWHHDELLHAVCPLAHMQIVEFQDQDSRYISNVRSKILRGDMEASPDELTSAILYSSVGRSEPTMFSETESWLQ